MKPLKIKEAYLIHGRLMIKSQITLKDGTLEIAVKPVIKKALGKVRGNPSLHELEGLLLVKGANSVEIDAEKITEIRTYFLRKDKEGLRNLFEASDQKPYLIQLSLGWCEKTFKLILNYNDGLKLRKALSKVRGR